MAEEINMVPGIAEEQTVNEVEVVQHGKMEFRLIDPTEAGFLKHIEWNKAEMEAAVIAKVAEYTGVAYTEETMKAAKSDRAELNKLLTAIEERRKKVKEIVNQPYADFEKEVKEVTALISKQIEEIDKQVKSFEDSQKEEKKKKIMVAYEEAIGELAGILPFEKVFDSRWLNKTYKLSTAQGGVRQKVEKFRTDLQTIDDLDSKYKLNAKDIYIETLDISKALAENKRLTDLEKKLEADRIRKEQEAEERRKAEEERKRRVEEAKKAEAKRAEEKRKTARVSSDSAVPFTSGIKGDFVSESPDAVPKAYRNVIWNQESVRKAEGNVSKPDESVQKPDGNVAEPLSGNEAPAKSDTPISHEDTKQYKTSFTVYGTRKQIMALKQYMVDNNLKFGKAEK